jgi:hypothetical protein
MAQLVEHIVHIDGVTGSSPVATTKNPWKSSISEDFLFMQMNHVSPTARRSEARTRTKKPNNHNANGFSFILDGHFVGSRAVHIESV